MEYLVLDAAGARPLVDQIVALYAVVYAEPPYEEGPEQVARFADTFPAELATESFATVAATVDEQLVGAAYGWTMPAGRWWQNTDAAPAAEVRDVPKFAVMEWMVRPSHRREGVGRTLMAMLLADRPERWATLASDPRAAARSIYARAGWQQVGRSKLSWGPAMDLLVLPLTPPAACGPGAGTSR
ncbi:GNAT family N-acetyltransferase [Phytohabitans sp. ZYX-F-186]|uniref:GNAT family N-acetyltransferase n=1 Tax=Phytohabitans maris TaxID=3071409 RepID=A0ABU0ZX54_9ACTN|nr:GNAT family N-acetyltransferase [Phytohabitans sp. ZYX-F-186]MDQ7910790.1 GNAT family N-acetyltransferase [Phytohabitans sp. ZYX-F-186]